MLESNAFDHDLEWTVLPMVNPTGFERNTRENHAGIDLNRDFKSPAANETSGIVGFLEQRSAPWDLALFLHEDWESDGFYLYQLADGAADDSARRIVGAVESVCPIDPNETIDEMPAASGIIRPDPAKVQSDPKLKGDWPEAIRFFMKRMARLQFTFESPSALDMPTRVRAQEQAIATAVAITRERVNREDPRGYPGQ